MKKWKDGKDRYGLLFDKSEVGVLYYHPLFGFYFTAYLGGGTRDIDLQSNSVAEAKSEAEQKLANLYRTHIDSLGKQIGDYQSKISFLNQVPEGSVKQAKPNSTAEQNEQNAYEVFKLQWMIDHGFTLTDLIECLEIMIREDALDGGDRKDLQTLFEAWEFGVGFIGGQIWPCLEEFRGDEIWPFIAEYRAYLTQKHKKEGEDDQC